MSFINSLYQDILLPGVPDGDEDDAAKELERQADVHLLRRLAMTTQPGSSLINCVGRYAGSTIEGATSPSNPVHFYA